MTLALLALAAFVQAPELPGDQFAKSISAGSDVNGDGVPDLAIVDATPHERVDVWIVSGRDASILRRHEIEVVYGSAEVDFLGDVDCDAHPDLVLGVRSMQDGWVEIVSACDGGRIRKLTQESLGVAPDSSVRATGDVDGDGKTDLLVFANRRTGPRSKEVPSVLILSGTDGSLLRQITGDFSTGMPTGSFADAGDVDGDGRSDVAICHEGVRSCRKIVVYSGRTGTPLHAIDGPFREFEFGSSMDGGHDFDRDGHPDLMIGSPALGMPIENPGWVRIFSGLDSALLASIGRSGVNRPDGIGTDAFGERVRFLRDLDEDGGLELLVGSPEEGLFEGAAYVLSGTTGAVMHKVEGRACSQGGCESDDYHTGRAVEPAGNLDQDGVEDFVVANVPYDRGQLGRVRAISGRCGDLLFDLDRAKVVDAERASRRGK